MAPEHACLVSQLAQLVASGENVNVEPMVVATWNGCPGCGSDQRWLSTRGLGRFSGCRGYFLPSMFVEGVVPVMVVRKVVVIMLVVAGFLKAKLNSPVVSTSTQTLFFNPTYSKLSAIPVS